MTSQSPPQRVWTPRIVFGFAAITLIWGSTWLVIKDQLGAVPPSWSIAYRFAIASVSAFALATLRRERLALGGAGLRLAALIGLLQFCGNFQFVYRAEKYLTSGVVAILFALLLVPNALLARAFLGMAVTRRFLIGSVIALGGIAMLLLHEWRTGGAGARDVLPGIALTLLGLACASCANVLQATQEARRHPPIVLLAWGMLAGAIMDVSFAWATAGPPVFDAHARYWLGVAYLAVFGSVVTFPIYSVLLRVLGPGRAAYSSVAIPVVAMFLSTVFEGYRWSVLAAAGAAVAMAGLVVALNARKPSR
ncbi:DMT family transporter [Novosphingobium cyanobacteriorum]|uniref:EamA family transporter n=1 Tax=Novosphingobium cyanobacteriorum TaxID=3024215 RepID=A0ABT6CFY2_9SPHN|nr:EamA family transporter [Novosphingobium cyanobacteriorum]MDF8332830.1 EamA family transporter [Novosphingobium cyanobacteriorum]